MVSNEEIKKNLQKKREEPIAQNKFYLICDKCGGYYKLEEDESPEDFEDDCKCGGVLSITDSVLDNYDDSNGSDTKNKWDKIWKARLAERQKERIEKSKAHKTQGIKSLGYIPWNLVGLILLTIVLFSFFGIFGLLIGILFIFLFRDF